MARYLFLLVVAFLGWSSAARAGELVPAQPEPSKALVPAGRSKVPAVAARSGALAVQDGADPEELRSLFSKLTPEQRAAVTEHYYRTPVGMRRQLISALNRAVDSRAAGTPVAAVAAVEGAKVPAAIEGPKPLAIEVPKARVQTPKASLPPVAEAGEPAAPRVEARAATSDAPRATTNRFARAIRMLRAEVANLKPVTTSPVKADGTYRMGPSDMNARHHIEFVGRGPKFDAARRIQARAEARVMAQVRQQAAAPRH